MQARMKNPVHVLPEALQALLALGRAAEGGGVPSKTLELVHLRTSQLNGCSVCVDAAWRKLRQAGETDERIFGVTAWRDMPYYSAAERAALALAEDVTLLGERRQGVPDGVWDEAARHYDEPALAALVISVAMQNVWNRLNVTVRQVAGAPWD